MLNTTICRYLKCKKLSGTYKKVVPNLAPKPLVADIEVVYNRGARGEMWGKVGM